MQYIPANGNYIDLHEAENERNKEKKHTQRNTDEHKYPGFCISSKRKFTTSNSTFSVKGGSKSIPNYISIMESNHMII